MDTSRRLLGTLLAAAFAASLAGGAAAYPERQVRIVVPLAAGGGADTLARKLAAQLAVVLGQPVVVDNKPGASGLIGADTVAKAAPDGHTLLLVPSGHFIIPAVVKKLPFDFDKDLAVVTVLTRSPSVLVAHKDMPGRSPKEFADHIRSNPGKYSFGTPEPMGLLLTSMYVGREKLKVTHVPYRGASMQLTDTAAGTVHFGVGSIGGIKPYLQSGRLRAVAITGASRVRDLPDVPTLMESSLPDFAVYFGYHLLAPGSTPPALLEQIQRAFHKALHAPELAGYLADTAQEPIAGPVAESQKAARQEMDMLLRTAKEVGLTPE